MIITSRSNPFVKHILSLREKKYRREYGEYIAEGIKQVREAHASGCAIEHIVCSESYTGDTFSPDKTVIVSDSVFAKLSEDMAPQGILAVLRIQEGTLASPKGRCLLLDGVRSFARQMRRDTKISTCTGVRILIPPNACARR